METIETDILSILPSFVYHENLKEKKEGEVFNTEKCIESAGSYFIRLPYRKQLLPGYIDEMSDTGWNSGLSPVDKKSFPFFEFQGNCGKVPAWLIIEGLKAEDMRISWKYKELISGNFLQLSWANLCQAAITTLNSWNKKVKNQSNIIAVPDDLPLLGQELLLSSLPGRKAKNKLLWRPIAAILGCKSIKDKIQNNNIRRICVIDTQMSCTILSDLEVEIENNVVVPTRRTFQKQLLKNVFYYFPADIQIATYILQKAISNDIAFNSSNLPEEVIWYLLTNPRFSKMLNEFFIKKSVRFSFTFPFNNYWIENTIDLKLDEILTSDNNSYSCKILSSLLNSINTSSEGIKSLYKNFETNIYSIYKNIVNKIKEKHKKDMLYIVTGPLSNLMRIQLEDIYLPEDSVIFDNKNVFVLNGCGMYAWRIHNNLPTYYDYLEGISLAVQDIEEEKVRPFPLVSPGRVAGNKTKQFSPIKNKFFIDRDSQSLKIYLCMAPREEAEDKPLKYKEQKFEVSLDKRYPLTLQPSVSPGQGLATVEVINNNLFDYPLEIDWLDMQNTKETIRDLNNKIERSFPPYLPAVRPSRERWQSFLPSLEYFLENKKFDDDFFRNIGYIYFDHNDPSGLGRINVFGSDPNNSIPSNADKQILKEFFELLEKKYRQTKEKDFLRAIAWTYQGDRFSFVKEELKKKLLTQTVNLSKVENTACANLFTKEEEIKIFFMAVLRKFRNIKKIKKFKNKGYQGMYYYVNTLKKILQYRNEATKFMHSFTYKKMMIRLLELLKYSYESEQTKVFPTTLIAMLFILKRRRYDRSFLKVGTSDKLLKKVLEYFDDIKNNPNSIFWNNKTLIEETEKYLRGSGTIEGFISIMQSDKN